MRRPMGTLRALMALSTACLAVDAAGAPAWQPDIPSERKTCHHPLRVPESSLVGSEGLSVMMGERRAVPEGYRLQSGRGLPALGARNIGGPG